MAKKRMFTIDIVDSDAFLDMPISAQALYFHLNMRADDDGFVGNPKKIMRAVGTSEDDLKVLIAKRFLITFDNGVIVIKHWRMHNTLSAIRYHETSYVSEKDMLKIKRNGAYTLDDGEPLDDSKLVEIASRQTKDEQKTNKRQTKDEQKTNADIDIGLDIGLGLDKDLDIGLDLEKDNDSKESSSSEMTFPDITSRWNELEHLGITPIRGIKKGSKREEAVRRLVRSYGEDDILIAINNIRSSPFLLGKKKDFIIVFDWFIKPANFQKVLEGNYKERGAVTDTQSIEEDLEARMKRLGLFGGGE